MKKITLCFSMIFLSLGVAVAQTSEKKIGLNANIGLSDYYGDWDASFFNTGKAFRTQVGLTGSYSLSPMFNVALAANYGSFGYHVPGIPLSADNDVTVPAAGFTSALFSSSAQLRFKFNNGMMLEENSMFRPYIFGGVGVADISKNYNAQGLAGPKGIDLLLAAGAGFDIMFTDNLGLNYNLTYGHTSSDDRDFKINHKVGNDQFMLHSVGVLYLLGKTADADNDGVSDKNDKCPDTPVGVKVDGDGCAMDSDKDGIPDHEDSCPKVAGVAQFKGCPDTDGDGIQDSEDACPEVKGVASAKGCPDADGDGIVDSEDACVDVAGIIEFKGCPDTDGDGIIDSEDTCPTVKGSVANNGCPDTDSDGILDKDDKCPTIAGVASNNGCPEIKEETKEVFRQALKGIQFESGKDVIKSQSYGILHNVATIMKENPSYKLKIDGHTDSQGDDAKNMQLSKDRASAVMKYLIEDGVEASRLSAFGFGETVPKATNDTAAGRAENRRVEFTVEF
ncbi:MAG: OmpA family protein [Crocinitomicaceae bacterium]